MHQSLPALGNVDERDRNAPGRPTALRCEFRVNPLGLDEPWPRLSWCVNDSKRGAVQSAYRIRVARQAAELDDDGPWVWDSGKISSDRTVHVEYDGPPLGSRRRYCWTVRTWDGDNRPSPWADPAFWEMAMLSASEWRADRITSDVGEGPREEIAMGDWIWTSEGQGESPCSFFRRLFDVRADAPVDCASIHITTDSTFHLFLNGRQIGHQAHRCEIAEYDLTALLRQGANVLAVQAQGESEVRGLTAGVRIRYGDGSCAEIETDDTWLGSSENAAGWKRIDFDTAGWERAVSVAPYGADPWGLPPRKPTSCRSICMRRDFQLPDRAVRAIAHVSGLGLYELHVNGRPAGEDIFNPGWTKYDRRVQYQAYDVTDLLQAGPNALGAIMGNGWWAGGLGLGRGNVERASSGTPRLIARLDVTCADGSEHVVTTDGNWRAHTSPIMENTFYHGETYDARLEMPGWDEPGFDETDWAPAAAVDEPLDLLVACKEPPICVTAVISAVNVSEPMDGVFVFDFGQNHAGRCRLRVAGARGRRVQLRFAERLNPDGTLYTDTLVGARNTDVYILKGEGHEVWEPRFTYRGYRYVELTGYPGRPPDDCLLSKVIHSAPDAAGTFACSDELLNRLYANIVWSQRSNMHSVPTDCPQRDERLGWMGDAQVFAPTACWSMEMNRFFTKWMDDIADSQGEDGHVTDVAPAAVVSGPAAPGWGDAVIVIPWVLYRFYGDRRIIERHFDTMRRWVEYMRANSTGHLYEREGYGDWVAIEESPKAPIGSAFYFLSTSLLARMAAIIGREREAVEYAQLADNIAGAFHAAYFDPTTDSYCGGEQTSNLLPLAFGITPPDLRASVLDRITEDIERRGVHLSTGFLGTGYIMPLLAAMGRQDLAWRLVTQRSYPSWGYMIERGATTMWELWNGDVAEPPMNSHNHFALGAVGQWFYEALAGINIDEAHAGFKRFIIAPQPAGDLAWVRAEYESMHGLIRSAWRRENGGRRFLLNVTIPANTAAEIRLPYAGGEGTRVRVDGVVLACDGDRAGDVDGLEWMDGLDDLCVFRAGSGKYEFVVDCEGSNCRAAE